MPQKEIAFKSKHKLDLGRWDDEAEVRLQRTMSYANSTLDHYQFAWIGDDVKDLGLHLYTDADFAGCKITQRSTGG